MYVLYSKGLPPPYRLDILTCYTFVSVFYKKQRNCIEMYMQFPAVAGTWAFGHYGQKDKGGSQPGSIMCPGAPAAMPGSSMK